jgi:hypothetical protein
MRVQADEMKDINARAMMLRLADDYDAASRAAQDKISGLDLDQRRSQ